MKTNQNKPLRFFTAFALSAILTAGLQLSASAAPDGPPDHQKMEHDWAKYRQERMKARLAKAAERLKIQPQQQAAWQAYADAVERPIGGERPDPNAPMDAASIAHRRADMAAGFAAKMVRVADATSALQAVLTPDQRQKFDKMVKYEHPHGPHRGHDGHHGFHRDDMPPRDGQPPAPPQP